MLVLVVEGENGDVAKLTAAEKAFESAELRRRVGAGGSGLTTSPCSAVPPMLSLIIAPFPLDPVDSVRLLFRRAFGNEDEGLPVGTAAVSNDEGDTSNARP